MTDTSLITIEAEKHLASYDEMKAAIAKCHSVDECKEIADHAAGLAAYFKQVMDDESVRKLLQIKLRAWRRIGEIVSAVDTSDCTNLKAKYQKIRETFKVLARMSDTSLGDALKLATLSADYFEDKVGDYKSAGSLLAAYECFRQAQWNASPERQEELRKEREAYEERQRKCEAQQAERIERGKREWREIETLVAARKEAHREVGLTLDRRDREHMKEVLFLIKEPVHEALRQAAFDNRMTMQAILRQGLAMWFTAHGYDVPISEMDLRAPNGRRNQRQHQEEEAPMS